MNKDLEKIYNKDKQLINQYFPEKQILILSSDDTYFLYLTNKSSMLNINPQTGILTKQDVDFAMKKVLQICPKKIVVNCEVVKDACSSYKKLNHGLFNPILVLIQLKEKCGLEYKPIKCTNHLCIAVGKK